MKHTYPRAIQLVEQGLIDVKTLISHQFTLENAVLAFSLASRRDGLKIIINLL
jgi:L-iditol 2-dehydrogenase